MILFIEDETKVKTKTHVDAAFALARLNDAILRVPTFVPNFTAIENFECQQHIKIFLRQLRGHKLWALQSKSTFSFTLRKFQKFQKLYRDSTIEDDFFHFNFVNFCIVICTNQC